MANPNAPVDVLYVQLEAQVSGALNTIQATLNQLHTLSGQAGTAAGSSLGAGLAASSQPGIAALQANLQAAQQQIRQGMAQAGTQSGAALSSGITGAAGQAGTHAAAQIVQGLTGATAGAGRAGSVTGGSFGSGVHQGATSGLNQTILIVNNHLSSTAASAASSGVAAGTAFSNGLRTGMDGVKAVVTTVMASLAALVAAATAGGGFAVKLAADAEQTQIAFTTLLGSAKQAKTFLADLSNFAAVTPFNLEGIQNASKRLLAFGFQSQEIIPIMTSIGDAVGALGGGAPEIDRVTLAIGQMQAKGKVSADEMNQLAELGINGWEMLAKKLGSTVAQVQKDAASGNISAAEGISALLEGMTAKFSGAMITQSTTFNGLLSTLQDNSKMAVTKIGKALIEGLNLKEGIVSLSAYVQKVSDWLTQSGVLERAMKILQGVISSVKTGFAEAGRVFGEVASFAQTMSQRIFDAAGGFKALEEIQGKASRAGAQFVSLLTSAWNGLRAVYSNVVVPIWEGLAPIVSSAVRRILPILSGLLEGATRVFNWIGKAAVEAGPYIKALEPVFRALGVAVDAAFKLIEAAWNGVLKPVLEALGRIFSSTLGAVIAYVKDNFSKIIGNFQGIFDGITEIFNAFAKLFRGDFEGFFKDLWEGIPKLYNNFKSAAEGLGHAIGEGIKAGLSKAWDEINDVITLGLSKALRQEQAIRDAGVTLDTQIAARGAARGVVGAAQLAAPVLQQVQASLNSAATTAIVNYCSAWTRQTITETVKKLGGDTKALAGLFGPSASATEANFASKGLTKPYNKGKLEEGDIVFWRDGGDGHVGVYAGNGKVAGNNRITYAERGGKFDSRGNGITPGIDARGEVDISRFGKPSSVVPAAEWEKLTGLKVKDTQATLSNTAAVSKQSAAFAALRLRLTDAAGGHAALEAAVSALVPKATALSAALELARKGTDPAAWNKAQVAVDAFAKSGDNAKAALAWVGLQAKDTTKAGTEYDRLSEKLKGVGQQFDLGRLSGQAYIDTLKGIQGQAEKAASSAKTPKDRFELAGVAVEARKAWVAYSDEVTRKSKDVSDKAKALSRGIRELVDAYSDLNLKANETALAGKFDAKALEAYQRGLRDLGQRAGDLGINLDKLGKSDPLKQVHDGAVRAGTVLRQVSDNVGTLGTVGDIAGSAIEKALKQMGDTAKVVGNSVLISTSAVSSAISQIVKDAAAAREEYIKTQLELGKNTQDGSGVTARSSQFGPGPGLFRDTLENGKKYVDTAFTDLGLDGAKAFLDAYANTFSTDDLSGLRDYLNRLSDEAIKAGEVQARALALNVTRVGDGVALTASSLKQSYASLNDALDGLGYSSLELAKGILPQLGAALELAFPEGLSQEILADPQKAAADLAAYSTQIQGIIGNLSNYSADGLLTLVNQARLTRDKNLLLAALDEIETRRNQVLEIQGNMARGEESLAGNILTAAKRQGNSKDGIPVPIVQTGEALPDRTATVIKQIGEEAGGTSKQIRDLAKQFEELTKRANVLENGALFGKSPEQVRVESRVLLEEISKVLQNKDIPLRVRFPIEDLQAQVLEFANSKIVESALEVFNPFTADRTVKPMMPAVSGEEAARVASEIKKIGEESVSSARAALALYDQLDKLQAAFETLQNAPLEGVSEEEVRGRTLMLTRAIDAILRDNALTPRLQLKTEDFLQQVKTFQAGNPLTPMDVEIRPVFSKIKPSELEQGNPFDRSTPVVGSEAARPTAKVVGSESPRYSGKDPVQLILELAAAARNGTKSLEELRYEAGLIDQKLANALKGASSFAEVSRITAFRDALKTVITPLEDLETKTVNFAISQKAASIALSEAQGYLSKLQGSTGPSPLPEFETRAQGLEQIASSLKKAALDLKQNVPAVVGQLEALAVWIRSSGSVKAAQDSLNAQLESGFSIGARLIGKGASDWQTALSSAMDGVSAYFKTGKIEDAISNTLGGILGLFEGASDTAKRVVGAFVETVKGVLSSLSKGDWIGAIVAGISGLINTIVAIFDGGAESVRNAAEKIKSIKNDLSSGMSGPLIDVSSFLGTIDTAAGWEKFLGIKNLQVTVSEFGIGIARTITNGFVTGFQDGIKGGLAGTGTLYEGLKNGLRKGIEDAFVQALIKNVVLTGALGKLLTQITEALTGGNYGLARTLLSSLPAEIKRIDGDLGGLVSDFGKGLDDAFGGIPAKVEPIVEVTKEIVKTLAQTLEEGLKSGFENGMRGGLKAFFAGTQDAASALQASLRDSIIGAITEAVIQGAVIKGALGSLLADLSKALEGGDYAGANALLERIASKAKTVFDMLTSGLEILRGGLDKSLPMPKDTLSNPKDPNYPTLQSDNVLKGNLPKLDAGNISINFDILSSLSTDLRALSSNVPIFAAGASDVRLGGADFRLGVAEFRTVVAGMGRSSGPTDWTR